MYKETKERKKREGARQKDGFLIFCDGKEIKERKKDGFFLTCDLCVQRDNKIAHSVSHCISFIYFTHLKILLFTDLFIYFNKPIGKINNIYPFKIHFQSD